MRTTQNQFFEPNTNKVLSLSSLMDMIEPEVVRLTNEYIRIWQETKRWGNKNHHWRVGLLRNRIMGRAEEYGVRVVQVSPAYTSQTCSGCGHRDKDNRSGERFSLRS